MLSLIGPFLNGCQPSTANLSHPTVTQQSEPTSTNTPEAGETVTPTVPSTPDPSATTQPSPENPACEMADGTLQKASFFSEILEADFQYQVYLPPCYHDDSESHYPVLYLLHGYAYTNQQWIRLGLVETMNTRINEKTLPPFIVVLPLEAPFEPPEISTYGEALIGDLIPWVDSHYRTLQDAQYRGVGGLSRGAAWAVRLGFEHWDHFSRVSAHSLPIFEADSSQIMAWMLDSPHEELPLFFIDIGRNDLEQESAQQFTALLDSYGIAHEWYLFNGDHTETYWAAHLDQYLQWHAANWQNISNNAVK
jgi:enterochelin esterase-like enzyme